MKKSIMAVIARYNEPVDWIENIGLDYIIYNKGNKIDSNHIDFERIVHVPNEGREGETYLRYITENYEEIPDLVVFLQGNPFDHFPRLFEVLKENENTKEIVSLGNNTFCDLNGNDSYPGLPMGHFRNLIIPGHSSDGRIDFIAGAQFIIPGDMIRNKPIEWWNELRDLYNKYWFSNIPSGYGIPNGHFIGHVFERLWPSIFKYKLTPNG
jgi:hypothetical protein